MVSLSAQIPAPGQLSKLYDHYRDATAALSGSIHLGKGRRQGLRESANEVTKLGPSHVMVN